MIFENIDTYVDTHQPPITVLVSYIGQRYLQNEYSDLRSEKPRNSLQIFESNFTPTTLPALPSIEIEQLEESRYQLLGKRQQLLDSGFLFLQPSKRRQIEEIEKQLDNIENQIILLQKYDRENEIESIEKFINDNEKLIQKYNSKMNTSI